MFTFQSTLGLSLGPTARNTKSCMSEGPIAIFDKRGSSPWAAAWGPGRLRPPRVLAPGPLGALMARAGRGKRVPPPGSPRCAGEGAGYGQGHSWILPSGKAGGGCGAISDCFISSGESVRLNQHILLSLRKNFHVTMKQVPRTEQLVSEHDSHLGRPAAPALPPWRGARRTPAPHTGAAGAPPAHPVPTAWPFGLPA